MKHEVGWPDRLRCLSNQKPCILVNIDSLPSPFLSKTAFLPSHHLHLLPLSFLSFNQKRWPKAFFLYFECTYFISALRPWLLLACCLGHTSFRCSLGWLILMQVSSQILTSQRDLPQPSRPSCFLPTPVTLNPHTLFVSFIAYSNSHCLLALSFYPSPSTRREIYEGKSFVCFLICPQGSSYAWHSVFTKWINKWMTT